MTGKEFNEHLNNILHHNGSAKQMGMAIEEMSELIKEICKDQFRYLSNKDAIAEEIADVYYSLCMIQKVYGISDTELFEIMQNKLINKILPAIDKEKNK